MTWLDKLEHARDVGELRGIMWDLHPGFAVLRSIAILGNASEGQRLKALATGRGIEVTAMGDHFTSLGMGLIEELDSSTPIVIASHLTLKAAEALRLLGFKHIAPFALLQLLSSEEYPPHPFYAGLLEDLIENREQYRALHDSLADDRSRDVLDACIGYRMTMDPRILESVIDWDLYNPPNLLHLNSEEIYADAGAYIGDTISLFLKRVNHRFARIFAFEPDKASFDKLSAFYGGDKRFRLVNAGLHSGRTYKAFDDGGSRESRFTDGAGNIAPVVSLDFILAGGKATFIKMNIEGDELEALDGARGTIQRWAPRLAISAYHRPSDLWRVPQKIRELNPDYKIYLRQHDGGIVETVCYAI